MLKKTTSLYLVYVVYFLGVGMTSSGIVLMPFNPFRYSIILATGLFLFSAGTFINEFVIDKKKVSLLKSLKLIMVSLTLAIGIGMISGGISHFKESPTYATFLIPLGFIISSISFFIKNNIKLSKKEIKILGFSLLLTSIVIFSSLTLVSNYYFGSNSFQTGGDVFMDTH